LPTILYLGWSTWRKLFFPYIYSSSLQNIHLYKLFLGRGKASNGGRTEADRRTEAEACQGSRKEGERRAEENTREKQLKTQALFFIQAFLVPL